MTAPIAWIWDGEAEVMRPMRRFLDRCRRELCDEQRYVLEPVDEEQTARDRAYHATMRDAWANLPEHLAAQWPSPTDFRRHCLIACGFATTKRLQFASVRAAQDALPLFATLAAEVEIQGAVVIAKTPMSQKLRGGMSKEDRLRSYQETQDLAAALIGVSRADLDRNAGRAA